MSSNSKPPSSLFHLCKAALLGEIPLQEVDVTRSSEDAIGDSQQIRTSALSQHDTKTFGSEWSTRRYAIE